MRKVYCGCVVCYRCGATFHNCGTHKVSFFIDAHNEAAALLNNPNSTFLETLKKA